MPETLATIVKKKLNIEVAKISDEDKAKGITSIGNISMKEVVEIAKSRKKSLAKSLKASVKEVLGTINSMNGILVEGKKPKEVIKEVEEGKWDSLIV